MNVCVCVRACVQPASEPKGEIKQPRLSLSQEAQLQEDHKLSDVSHLKSDRTSKSTWGSGVG